MPSGWPGKALWHNRESRGYSKRYNNQQSHLSSYGGCFCAATHACTFPT